MKKHLSTLTTRTEQAAPASGLSDDATIHRDGFGGRFPTYYVGKSTSDFEVAST